jgi:hypothetical protein
VDRKHEPDVDEIAVSGEDQTNPGINRTFAASTNNLTAMQSVSHEQYRSPAPTSRPKSVIIDYVCFGGISNTA